jgi:acyl carrier protein
MRWTAVLLIGAALSGCGGGPAPGPATAGSPGPETSAAPAQPASTPDRAAVVERLRAELATLLKREPGQLPTNASVAKLGADDLTVVEWQMAAERTFRVDLDENRLFEPGTKTRGDLTIETMAAIVETGKPWPPGRTR